MKRETGSSIRIEYVVTIDVVKHISMLQKNKKGKEVRNYFIEKEKIANVPNQLTDMEIMAKALTISSRTISELENKIVENKAL